VFVRENKFRFTGTEEDLDINDLPGSIHAAPAEIMESEDEEEEVAVPVRKLPRKWIRKDTDCMLPKDYIIRSL
jgi:hypothetical protein